VCRLRLWLLVALGVLILVVGIAIGAGGARREAMRGGGPGRPGMPGPGPQAMPMHQGPMGQPAGGHGAGGPAPRMPEGAGPGPRERRGRGGDR
jgi:hypothetical protein